VKPAEGPPGGRPEHWSRVKDLLHAALEQKRDERAGYLADACGDDEALRNEVESLLLASERAERFMETPAGIGWVDAATAAAERVLRIGPYRILREIGRGGMAAVYLAARDDGEYRKDVAIKVVQNPFASQCIVGRFRQERQILADLDHQNIARLLDGGTTEDDLPYLVLEHIVGSPIDAYCDEHRLSLIERLRLFCEVCSAVSYAHQRHVIHRDLKPSNIFVTADGTPKLLDFGIAKLLDGSDQPGDRTVTGWRLMTPEYASPEQLRGEAVGVPADVYALGVLLYRLVTGRSPYRPSNDQPHELARAICEDEPEMPSAVLRQLKSSRRLARDLDAIAMKALSKDPKARYASVEQFAGDVRRYLDRLPITARRPTMAHRVGRLIVRPGGARLAATALLVAIVGLTGVVSFRNGAGSDRSDSRPMSVGTLTTLGGNVSSPVFSADGNFIAFSWSGEGNSGTQRPGIYTVPVAGGTPVRLTSGLGGEEWPAWSPDGNDVAFVREMRDRSGIFSVPARGGPERKLLDLRDDRYFWLGWSPDGRHLAFADRGSSQEPYRLSLLSLDTLERHRLASSPSDRLQSVLRFAFSPDGQTLAFIAIGSPNVDVCLLSLGDDKTRSIYSQREWIGGLAWTADGQALVLSLNQHGTRRLMKLPASGAKPEPLPIGGEDAYYPAVSRSGNRLAFVRDISDTDLWRVELNAPPGRGRPAALVTSTRRDAEPRFSPDGKKIAFQSNRSGSLEIWVSDADGSNQRQLTSFNGPNAAWPSWSPDGRHIVLWAGALYVVSSKGGPPSRVSDGEMGGELPSWSKDGKWIYSASGINPNVWKVPAQGGRAIQITKNGAFSARESPDGQYLYYTKSDGPGIWRVPVSGGQETRVIEEFPQHLPDYWDVVDDGIYFADPTTSPYPTIKFLSFATRRKTPVAMLAGPAVAWGGGLTVSPDRRSIVYTQSTYSRSEIMLVDNFR
jgi:Tol biopolymer transport system component